MKWLDKIPAGWMLAPDDMYLITDCPIFDMNPHEHGVLEFNYLQDGSCLYQIGEDEILLKRRHLLLFDSSVPHRVVFSQGCESPSSLLGGSFYACAAAPGCLPLQDLARGGELRSLNNHLSDGPVILSDAASYGTLLHRMLSEFDETHNHTYLGLLLDQLLMDVARSLDSTHIHPSNHVQRIKDYVQFNYSNILNMEDIASSVCLSKNYMERIFRQQTGSTVWQYLTDVRMKAACTLLTETDMCIGEIDEHVGINSRQNFYLLFHKAYGISPAAYRKQFRMERDETGFNPPHGRSPK